MSVVRLEHLTKTFPGGTTAVDEGRLQQVGSPEELYQEPANRFVAGFMGSPSMNFATVRLRGTGR